jgi:hypothetical protein
MGGSIFLWDGIKPLLCSDSLAFGRAPKGEGGVRFHWGKSNREVKAARDKCPKEN